MTRGGLRSRWAGGVIALLGCLLVFGTAVASATPASSLVGTWSCCGAGGAGAQTWKISTMSASSGAFTGSGGGGGETFPVTGHLTGRSVTLTTGPYKLLTSYSATFTGTLAASAKTISGSWKSTEGQTGTWTARLTTALKKLTTTKPKKKATKPKKKKAKAKKKKKTTGKS
jgi:hypothetical protein